MFFGVQRRNTLLLYLFDLLFFPLAICLMFSRHGIQVMDVFYENMYRPLYWYYLMITICLSSGGRFPIHHHSPAGCTWFVRIIIRFCLLPKYNIWRLKLNSESVEKIDIKRFKHYIQIKNINSNYYDT